MRQSPQFIVPLLLFLILVLVGSLVWLQWSQHQEQLHQRAEQRQRAEAAAEAAEAEASAEAALMEDEAARSGRARQAQEDREREAIVVAEPLRDAADDEWKPDLRQAEAEAALRAERLSALLAESAGVARVLLESGEPAEGLNARAQWLVPPLQQLGIVTPESIKGAVDRQLTVGGKGDDDWQRWLVEAGVSKDEKRISLLTGRVIVPELHAGEAGAWAPLNGPPIVIRSGGLSYVANSDGWFAVLADPPKGNESLEVVVPGFRVAGGKSLTLSDLKRLQGDGIMLERVPMVALTVRYRPGGAVQGGLQAWLEIWGEPESRLSRARSVGLFLESKVPEAGSLTFLFPETKGWTKQPVRFGAGGDGWGMPSPRRLGDSEERSRTPASGVTRLRADLTLERAHTSNPHGECVLASGKAPDAPVRIEGSHTGVVSWTNSRGRFDFHVNYERGNWRQDLRVETLGGDKFSFGLAYDDARMPFAELAANGRSPDGPWRITVPSPLVQGTDTLLYWTGEQRISEVWVRNSDGLYLVLKSRYFYLQSSVAPVADVLTETSRVYVRLVGEPQLAEVHLRYGEVPAGALQHVVDPEPYSDNKPKIEKAGTATSRSQPGWIISPQP